MNQQTIATALLMVLVSTAPWVVTGHRSLLAATAQEAVPQVPTLTETQRLQFQVLAQQMEIATLKYEAARTEIARMVLSVQVPGYTFELGTLSYRPEPKKESSP